MCRNSQIINQICKLIACTKNQLLVSAGTLVVPTIVIKDAEGLFGVRGNNVDNKRKPLAEDKHPLQNYPIQAFQIWFVIYTYVNKRLEIEFAVVCHYIWPLPSIVPSFIASDLWTIVLLQVFGPLHIRPLGFQYHDVSDLALVQYVVLRLSPPSSVKKGVFFCTNSLFVHSSSYPYRH